MYRLSALCAVCVAVASPSGGSCPRPRPRTDEGRVTVAARKRDVAGKLPLIRPCGATFPQRGRLGITPPPARPMHHLSALCAVCVAVASPLGGSCPRPRPRTDEGRVTVAARKRDVAGKLPLIRPCGATFPQRGRLGITPPPARPMHHPQRRCARPWCAFRCPAGSTRWQSGHRRLQCPAPRRAGCPCQPAAPAWP